MRKLIYAINLTADGCCDHTKFSGDPTMMEYYTDLIGQAGLFVYGRKTYDLMCPFWPDMAKDESAPKSERDYALVFDSIPKLVFSKTLDKVDDKMSELAKGGLVEEMIKLKQQDGNSIMIGGVDLASQAIAQGLIDEFYFVIHPVIIGEGRRLFDTTIMEKLNLKLVDTKILGSGSVALHYVKESADNG